ncbi:hypothetical protein [Leifsonia sp. Root227]|uniref:hypothetical protein n=1 Tax=Leifsonia sp. Root227 TaxID=1736496 RepID=UPI000AAC6065|nr:hypothetical protein [Leifsonia sp. Root227]
MKPLGIYPAPAPFTPGSKFVDSDHPNHGPFTVFKYGSSFGDDYLIDIAQQWHEPDHCRVVAYLSPEALEQRKQDRVLERLMAVYSI